MSVRRFLDVSSGHLSVETWTWLDAQTDADLVRASAHRHAEILGGRTRHGWFVYASEAPVEPIPADLAAIMRRARRHDCEYVLFDVDARLSKDLPILHPGFQGTPSPA